MSAELVDIAERAALLSRGAVRRWMQREAADYQDNPTALAEAAAEAFDVKDEGGPLDDETHWIWDEAIDAYPENDAEA
jgi:hypothetical protein